MSKIQNWFFDSEKHKDRQRERNKIYYCFIRFFLLIRNGKNGYAVIQAKYVFNDTTAYDERRAVISRVPTLKKSLIWKAVSSTNDIKIMHHGLNVLASTGVYFIKQGLHQQKHSFCDEYSYRGFLCQF